ncbi:MAG: signal peptidase I [Rickettsiales bacterium]|jgi:signal peptidase I|nr:signal peptidase I [Rickettsiales bacterium]|tara:strand:- start:1230 stop:2030 length:801 start_codon:yes stop_codon:yes gene_type:complete
MDSENADNPKKAEPKGFRAKLAGVIELIRTVVYAIVIAVCIRTFAYEPFSIPSGSMIPTLLIGDYLFVSKFSYGYSRHSLPFSLPLFEGRVLGTSPKRGDVAVFKFPVQGNSNYGKDYIKRIIGLPGDRVQVLRGFLHINGKPVRRLKIEDFKFPDGFYSGDRVAQYIETLPNGSRHRLIEMFGDRLGDDGDRANYDNTREWLVPANHYFVMGDNRDNSSDSRAGWTVPVENLVGRAEFLFFSKPAESWIFEIWNWRFSRVFHGIE